MKEKVFIQLQSTAEERKMLSEIAEARGVSMSAQVRAWIRDVHKRMERKAA